MTNSFLIRFSFTRIDFIDFVLTNKQFEVSDIMNPDRFYMNTLSILFDPLNPWNNFQKHTIWKLTTVGRCSLQYYNYKFQIVQLWNIEKKDILKSSIINYQNVVTLLAVREFFLGTTWSCGFFFHSSKNNQYVQFSSKLYLVCIGKHIDQTTQTYSVKKNNKI